MTVQTKTQPQKWSTEEETTLLNAKTIWDLKEILKTRSARSCYDKAKKLGIDTSKIEGLCKYINSQKCGRFSEQDLKNMIESYKPSQKDFECIAENTEDTVYSDKACQKCGRLITKENYIKIDNGEEITCNCGKTLISEFSKPRGVIEAEKAAEEEKKEKITRKKWTEAQDQFIKDKAGTFNEDGSKYSFRQLVDDLGNKTKNAVYSRLVHYHRSILPQYKPTIY